MKKGFVFFDDFIFRTPLFNYDRNNLKSKNKFAAFDEAIFLASPEFFKEQNKATESSKSDPKIDQSLYKYLTRATTRCTPFGLFAGCSIGHFGQDDYQTITLAGQDSYKRVTRLDMNYLCALVQNLESMPEIRKRLRYYPNDSIYYLGGKLRYIEYFYAGTRRIHRISSVNPDDYLTGILKLASSGKYIEEIVDSLVGDEIEDSEAREYVDELISSQLLKSELELCVTGSDAFERLITQITGINEVGDIAEKLNSINECLKRIDASRFGESLDEYQKIISIVKEIGVAFEPKFLFQTGKHGKIDPVATV